MISSFSSNSSQMTWDENAFTPSSSRRESFDSVVNCNDSFNTLTQGLTVNEGYGFCGGFSTVPVMDDSMMSLDIMLQYNNMQNNGMGNFPHHGLPMDLMTPTSEMDMGQKVFVDPQTTIFGNPYDFQSPMPMVQFEISPISEYGLDYSSPGTMDYGTPSSYKAIKLADSRTPSRCSFRQTLCEPLATSVALHRVQNGNGEHKKKMRAKTESLSLPDNLGIEKISRAKKQCTYPGCVAKFQRQEHLKRHEKTHTNTECFPCPFFGPDVCNKKFGRTDNLTSHILLHSNKNKKSSRTPYVEGAYEYWLNMKRKGRKQETARIKTEHDEKRRSSL